MTDAILTAEMLLAAREMLLREHRRWVEGLEKGIRGAGSRLDLSGENLRFVNLHKADLRNAHIEGADFTGATMEGVRGVELQPVGGS